MANQRTLTLTTLTVLLSLVLLYRVDGTEGLPMMDDGISCTCEPEPQPEQVCGSDGVTYDSLCSFMIASCQLQFQLTIENSGPCPTKWNGSLATYKWRGLEGKGRETEKVGANVYTMIDESVKQSKKICNIFEFTHGDGYLANITQPQIDV